MSIVSPVRMGLACLAMAWGTSTCLAQSAYVFNRLQPPLATTPEWMVQPGGLDAGDQVWGTSSCGRGARSSCATVWPVSAAADVAARPSGVGLSMVKVLSDSGLMLGADGAGRHATAVRSGTVATLSVDGLDVNVSVTDVNNASWVSGITDRFGAAGTTWRAVLWRGGQPTLLSNPLGGPSAALGLNNRGAVVGWVSEPDANPNDDVVPEFRAARWVNGVLEWTGDIRSEALAVNDAGQMVLSSYSQQDARETVTVLDNGKLSAPVAAHAMHILVRDFNHDAVMVGVADKRAFLWKDGVTHDLTSLALAKGAKLPEGAVLDDVKDINDKGSMLVRYVSQGHYVWARLTAQP